MATSSTPSYSPENIERIRTGQRFINLALLSYFAAVVSYAMALRPEGPGGVVAGWLVLLLAAIVTTFILAITGIVRLTGGLGYGLFMRILMMLLLIVPVAGLLILLNLNSKGTKALRAAGYRVGLLGAAATAK